MKQKAGIALLAALSLCVGPSTADAQLNTMRGDFYGNPQIQWSLSDTQTDSRILQYANRVRFPFSGSLVAVRKYIIYVPGQPGGDAYYHKGDGGTMLYRMETDDGTDAHRPSGVVLGESQHIIGAPELYEGSGPAGAIPGGDPGDDNNFRKIYFKNPVDIKAGDWYHLTVQNSTFEPQEHFVSMDDMRTGGSDRKPQSPKLDDLDYSVEYLTSTGWTSRDQFTAIVEYHFADGTVWGNGYMEVGTVQGIDRATKELSVDQPLRQVFTPPRDLEVNSVNVAGVSISGSNSVNASLQTAEGVTLWSGTLSGFPAAAIGAEGWALTAARFVGVATPTVSLAAGEQYHLVLESTGGRHGITSVRDGSIYPGVGDFAPSTIVVGQAEYLSGGEWLGWDTWSGPGPWMDMSFYFDVTPPDQFVGLRTRVLLQGAFENGVMRDDLGAAIPLVQPFGSDPFGYDGDEAVTAIPSGIVDWVLVELVDANGGAVGRRACFVDVNGFVVDTNAVSPCGFERVPLAEYSIVVRQRNHLAIGGGIVVVQ